MFKRKLIFGDISYPMLIPASVFQTTGSGKYMCMNNLRVVIAWVLPGEVQMVFELKSSKSKRCG